MFLKSPEEIRGLSLMQEAFFTAMLQGWVSGAKPEPIPALTWYKGFIKEVGDFTVIDAWTSRGDNSCGSTRIYNKTGLAWIMNYHGQYDKKGIQFLKKVLKFSYESGIFHAGRGPECFKLSNSWLEYTCQEGIGSNFSLFAGKESIFDHGNLVGCGWHKFSGMSLI